MACHGLEPLLFMHWPATVYQEPGPGSVRMLREVHAPRTSTSGQNLTPVSLVKLGLLAKIGSRITASPPATAPRA